MTREGRETEISETAGEGEGRLARGLQVPRAANRRPLALTYRAHFCAARRSSGCAPPRARSSANALARVHAAAHARPSAAITMGTWGMTGHA